MALNLKDSEKYSDLVNVVELINLYDTEKKN